MFEIFGAVSGDMSSTFTILLAYMILALGPAIGTYYVIANAGKLIGGFVGGMNKLGKMGAKGLTKVAKNQYRRGDFGQAMANRSAIKDEVAKRRSIRNLESGKGWGSKLSSIGLDDEGRQIRSTYLADQKKAMDEREVNGHLGNLSKQASGMLAMGYKYDDGSKTWSGTKLDGTHETIKEKDLDPMTQGSLQYARQNNLVGTKNGSRAIAKSLIDTGEIRMEHMQRLTDQIKSAPGLSKDEAAAEAAAFTEHTRAAAQAAGIDSLKFMSLDSGGKLDFEGVTKAAGEKTNPPAVAKANIAKKIVSAGPSKLNKYAYKEGDKEFVDAMGAELIDKEAGSSDWFETELAGMGADSVKNMSEMIATSAMGQTMFGTGAAGKAAAAAHYATAHNAARAKHHK